MDVEKDVVLESVVQVLAKTNKALDSTVHRLEKSSKINDSLEFRLAAAEKDIIVLNKDLEQLSLMVKSLEGSVEKVVNTINDRFTITDKIIEKLYAKHWQYAYSTIGTLLAIVGFLIAYLYFK